MSDSGPALKRDYFELFGLPQRYRLDRERLESAYRELQARIHPDKFARASDAERRISMQWTAHANAAYRTLKHPLERACYLLELQGVAALEQNNAALPAEFLLQQMEWREAVVQAEDEQDVAALARLEGELARATETEYAALARLLDETRDFPAAADSARKLKFMDKLKDEIGDALATLDA